MEYANLMKALLDYGDAIVRRARTELKRTRKRVGRRTKWKDGQPIESQKYNYNGKIEASGALGRSLRPDLVLGKNLSPNLEIKGEDYGVYMNQGRPPTRGGGDGAVRRGVLGWMKVKPIKARDFKTGRFIKQEAAAFMIARKIHHFGIEPTNFMRTAMNTTTPRHRAKLAQALGEDARSKLTKKRK